MPVRILQHSLVAIFFQTFKGRFTCWFWQNRSCKSSFRLLARGRAFFSSPVPNFSRSFLGRSDWSAGRNRLNNRQREDSGKSMHNQYFELLPLVVDFSQESWYFYSSAVLSWICLKKICKRFSCCRCTKNQSRRETKKFGFLLLNWIMALTCCWRILYLIKVLLFWTMGAN